MAKRLIFLVGTMSGTAEMVADDVSGSKAVKSRDLVAKVMPMKKATAAVLREDAVFVICTSSYGVGEPPEGAVPFYEELITTRPDLSGVRYGVIALGDSSYAASFHGAPKKFDAILSELGAQRIGQMCLWDVQSGQFPEDVAQEWFNVWIEDAVSA